MIEELIDQRVLVLGLAKSGEAAARLLHELGANVTVNDAKAYEPTEQIQALEALGVTLICGGHPLELLDDEPVLIVKNPGIRYDNSLLVEAEKKGIPIITEIELAARVSEAQMIAITGSNGKTTTTTLIGMMLEGSPKTPKIAGNIGTVACEVAKSVTDQDLLVMEVSSFQLMGTIHFEPKVAVLLNLFDAHLDYHGTKEAYITAKARIFANQTEADFIIYNADDPIVRSLAQQAKAKRIPFSRKEITAEGLSLQNEVIYFQGKQIIECDAIRLPGEHNLESVMAAIGAAMLMGASKEQIRHVLTTFGGVEHRLQYVTTVAERLFYNDSKASNSLATKAAIASFTRPIVLLAGGLDRGNSFDDLVPSFAKIDTIITFGETKEKLAAAAKEAGVRKILSVNRVAEAVPVAFEHSNRGDVILLSPACASWDQYPNFEIRGKEFVQAIAELSEVN